ncbi:hypothetical protein TNCV_1771241 [Trichonephila clavipes]|nr:hypothetical protein TNCV_1771241 [Trichonephila clavipes]
MSTMSQRSHLTDSDAWRVVGRLERGQTQAEVAQAIGVSQRVISRIWNSFWRLEVQAEDQDKERLVAGRQPPPQTLQELERALLEEWDRISPNLVFNSLIEYLPQRFPMLLLAAHGNHTPY